MRESQNARMDKELEARRAVRLAEDYFLAMAEGHEKCSRDGFGLEIREHLQAFTDRICVLEDKVIALAPNNNGPEGEPYGDGMMDDPKEKAAD